MGDGPRLQSLGYHDCNLDVLSDLGLRDGQPVDDPFDCSDHLAGHQRIGLWINHRRARDLVRHNRIDCGRSRIDYAARGDEPVYHQQYGQADPHHRDLSRGDVFRGI